MVGTGLHAGPATGYRIRLERHSLTAPPPSLSSRFSYAPVYSYVGATIPRFCYHDRLNIAGNCR